MPDDELIKAVLHQHLAAAAKVINRARKIDDPELKQLIEIFDRRTENAYKPSGETEHV